MKALTWLIFVIVTGNAAATVYLVKDKQLVQKEDKATVQVHKDMQIAVPAPIMTCEEPLDAQTCK